MIAIKEYEEMAKFDLPEAERQELTDRLEKLIADFSALEKIDTAGTEPLVTVLDINNIMRNDVVKKFFTREELLSGAPEEYDGYFRVPKTLD